MEQIYYYGLKVNMQLSSETHKQIFDCLHIGLLIFAENELLYSNESACRLLQISTKSQELGPYQKSLKSFLQNAQNGYTKQLTGILGKPLNATFHQIQGWKVIEISESYETKLGEASHELRRPLTNIKTLVDTLYLWGAGDDPKARPRFLGQLHQEINRLTKLVNELLDLSRMQAGSIPLNHQQISLKILVDETIDLLTEQANQKAVKLLNQIPGNFRLIGDLDKLTHVIQNLIENAIRYNQQNGQVIIKEAHESHTFIIQDTGLGIAPENVPLMFERFKRFNKDIPGTGLGLAIVKSIVDLHGGTILVNSRPGEGTAFTVFIPPQTIAVPVN